MKTQNTQNTAGAPAKPTPGAWHIGLQKCIYADRDGTQIAFCDIGTNFDDENLANARLIAAAPELLAALAWFADELPGIIRQCCPDGVPMELSKAHDAARAVIAKAKGL